MGDLVSVLIPTRNRPQLAVKAVKSALAQAYDSIEIIVTDNSDTDVLGNILATVADQRIRYVKNRENIGPIPNWRSALEISNGKYCLVLPDDDYLINPFYIEDSVKILADSTINLVITDCILSYPSKNAVGFSGHTGLINGHEFIRKGLRIPHIGNVFRREGALCCNAFLSNDILWSDVELWMKLLSTGNAYCYSKPSMLYLFHDNNIVLNMSKSQLIANSKFIRPSVEAIADEKLVSELVIRYLCRVDSYGDLVDLEFVESVIGLNKIDSMRLQVLAQFYFRSAKRRIKSAAIRMLRAGSSS